MSANYLEQMSELRFGDRPPFRFTNEAIQPNKLESRFIGDKGTKLAQSQVVAVSPIKYVLGWIIRIQSDIALAIERDADLL